MVRIDGRRLRSERTRQLIIEACLTLVRRDQRMPTAADIAAQAGCAIRSVFERFEDLNQLILAAADYAIALGDAEATPEIASTTRSSRIREHVAIQSDVCERWLPLWRVLLAAQENIPSLRERVVVARLKNVDRLRAIYRPELAGLAEAERERLILALSTVVSFESWEQLRNGFSQSVEAARLVWGDAVDRLLPRPH